MNQKTWETNNTKIITSHICCNCNQPITQHQHYNDSRFCEECKQEITADYDRKRNDPDDQEQINYFGWYTAELFLSSVYEELTKYYNSSYEY